MGAFRLTRRAFLWAVSAGFSVAAIPFRRRVPRGDDLNGEWTVVEYVCDGKPALTMARKARIAITADKMTIWLQLPDMMEHKESYRYTVHSPPEIDN